MLGAYLCMVGSVHSNFTNDVKSDFAEEEFKFLSASFHLLTSFVMSFSKTQISILMLEI